MAVLQPKPITCWSEDKTSVGYYPAGREAKCLDILLDGWTRPWLLGITAMATFKPSGLADQTHSLHGPNWKPWAFHPLYIFFICILHILYIVGIQLIVSRSKGDADFIQRVQKNETIDRSESIFVFDEGNMNAYLTWQYLPIALATILAILWESLDLTVRRLEPFHQLSMPEGGDVDNALCLEYTGSFSFTVPFRALRQRHYAVVMSSSLFVTVATIVTALSGGMWGIEWASLSYSAERVDGPNGQQFQSTQESPLQRKFSTV